MPTSFIQLAPDSTGKKLKTYDEGAEGHTKYLRENEPATFWAVYDRIAGSATAAKYMATLWNGAAGRVVTVKQVWRTNWQVAAATGKRLEQEFVRISARTVGTAVTPIPVDNDTLTAGITASHNDSLVTDGALLRRVFAIDEEVLVTAPVATAMTEAQFLLGMMANDRGWQMVWDATRGVKALILRNGQGIAVKNLTTVDLTAPGSISYRILFTDEPA